MMTYAEFQALDDSQKREALIQLRDTYSNGAIAEYWNIKLQSFVNLCNRLGVPRRKRKSEMSEEDVNPGEYGFHFPGQEPDPEPEPEPEPIPKHYGRRDVIEIEAYQVKEPEYKTFLDIEADGTGADMAQRMKAIAMLVELEKGDVKLEIKIKKKG